MQYHPVNCSKYLEQFVCVAKQPTRYPGHQPELSSGRAICATDMVMLCRADGGLRRILGSMTAESWFGATAEDGRLGLRFLGCAGTSVRPSFGMSVALGAGNFTSGRPGSLRFGWTSRSPALNENDLTVSIVVPQNQRQVQPCTCLSLKTREVVEGQGVSSLPMFSWFMVIGLCRI